MRFYQLKIGHGAVGTFLARICLIETRGAERKGRWLFTFIQNVESGGKSEEN